MQTGEETIILLEANKHLFMSPFLRLILGAKLIRLASSIEKQLLLNFVQATALAKCKVSKMVCLGRKLKLTKTCEKPLYNHTRVVLCKKRLPKIANIRKMKGFGKWPKLATRKRLYPRKMVCLRRKLKFTKTCEKPLYNHTSVVLCKERLQQSS